MRRRVGLMWHGDRRDRETASLETSRFSGLAQQLFADGFTVEPVIYNDEFADEVRAQLLNLHAVQVWVNPIAGGKDRNILDAMLRDVAANGTLVFTHPDTIMRMGTKRVLYDLRSTSIGSDVYEHSSLDSLRAGLANRLPLGARVLKQFRGHSGGGIWKFSDAGHGQVLLRHAERGCPEELVSFEGAIERMRNYFETGGRMFEQPFQERIGDGMIRIYLVGDEVAGFGHQEAVALVPAKPGEPMPEMGPRLYYPPDESRFQPIRRMMEYHWLEEIKQALSLRSRDLPLLWDVDLMFGPQDAKGEDTYVLCEINVSSVSPYPEWANEKMAKALRRVLDA